MARRTHCPQGRPLYRVDEIPDHLATVTMLRLQRRRPAPGQQPAATLLYSGNQYTELWTIVDTEQMPVLSPGRQAAWTAARTCARCSHVSEQPWPRDERSRSRLCPPCAEAEAESTWRRDRNRARADAVAWARGILADPAAVLIHEENVAVLTFGAYAATPAGQVLLDAPRIRHNERDFADTPGWNSWTDADISITAIAEQVRALRGRRLIVWDTRHGGHGLTWNMRTRLDSLMDLAVAPRPYLWAPGIAGDELGRWYADWLGVRAGDGSWRYHRGITSPPLHREPAATPPPAADSVHRMRVLLTAMAADDHPAGPPVCPALHRGGREMCGAGDVGADGLCPTHSPTTVEVRRD